jgi:hypothetical protein
MGSVRTGPGLPGGCGTDSLEKFSTDCGGDRRFDGHQTHGCLAVARKNDLIAGFCPTDQLRQLPFGLSHGNLHSDTLTVELVHQTIWTIEWTISTSRGKSIMYETQRPDNLAWVPARNAQMTKENAC